MKYHYSEALKIAQRGAEKMQTEIGEGKFIARRVGEGEYLITRKNGKQYRIRLYFNPDNRLEFFGSCDCPFCQNGIENGTCKHIQFSADLEIFAQSFAEDTATVLSLLSQD